MSRYILRRVLQVVPVVFGLSVAVFLMLRLIPGDVVDVILGTEGVASQERLAQLRKLFGLDRPFHEQYFEWAGSLLRGDFGRSIRTSRPILPDILARFPVTIQLTAMAMVMSLALAIPLGVVSAVRRYTRSDAAVRVFGLLGMAILMRMTRSSMLEVLRQEYVVTARAKGLVERLVVYRHALRNALIPVVTVAGIQVGYLLGGAIIVEQIFALPGVGTLVLNGISQRDYPVVQGGVLFIATSFVLVNLAVDIVYAYVDPKIHYQ